MIIMQYTFCRLVHMVVICSCLNQSNLTVSINYMLHIFYYVVFLSLYKYSLHLP